MLYADPGASDLDAFTAVEPDFAVAVARAPDAPVAAALSTRPGFRPAVAEAPMV